MTHALSTAQGVCGQPIARVDGPLKVTGKARYAADHKLPGMAYAALVCSTVACGGVDRVDSRVALRQRDVLAVLTDFAGVKLPFDTHQVSFFGQPVAVVIATTSEAAAHGASLVDVRYWRRPQLTRAYIRLCTRAVFADLPALQHDLPAAIGGMGWSLGAQSSDLCSPSPICVQRIALCRWTSTCRGS
ncbi:hypothetical protein MSHI_14550 [Mycobacterium shinjukuense]|uniref:Aldehyde oxidase/xanthine dehydrogenase a/b hammerhead domain-containing protein n=1 Tax=Mycobacterium shinjukuense TaxID=398694 RepID=A0A7I7MQG2_9MYCO|nr:hypothetical protein [Mycobacterium shinjukuense]BBX73549.1 hypothetical protein MSHI_14550 [Mycobacterium shinjukuense]